MRHRHQTTPAFVEALENRTLLAATAPVITSIVMDNRGTDYIAFNQAINTTTLTTSTVKMYGPGADLRFGTADDAAIPVTWRYSRGLLTVKGAVRADHRYRLVLTTGIKGTNGIALNGTGGRRGGNFDVTTAATTTTARFDTVAGTMNVALVVNPSLAATIQDIEFYMDKGAYDNSIIHRNGIYDPAPNGPLPIIQGGSFYVNSADQVTAIDTSGHAKIDYAQGLNNTLGTIAIARSGSLTASGDSGFFFNTATNPILDAEQYCAFGSIIGRGGLAALAKLAAYPALNSSTDQPVTDPTTIAGRGGAVNPQTDFVIISRVALLATYTVTSAATPDGVRAAAATKVSAPAVTFSAAPITADFLHSADDVL